MVEKIIRFADEFNMLPRSGTVLICVSGGADSMSLLEALLEISHDRGFGVSAAHYNHMLRGRESARDEMFVREYCAARGIPFYPGAGDVNEFAKKHKLGIEDAARESRYSFFFETAKNIGAGRIATAHTADDNAETMILNLVRGAGAVGLSGIPPVRDIVIRPMLRVSRDEVMRFVDERGIPFVEDSTNNLNVYTRNKVRNVIMPVIREINPKYYEAMAAASTLSRADEEYLARIADEYISNLATRNAKIKQEGFAAPSPVPCSLPPAPLQSADREAGAAELSELPFAISGRIIRKLYGGSLSFKHVAAVLDMCKRDNPSACLSLPGMTVYREYDRVLFCKNRTDNKQELSTDYSGFSIQQPGFSGGGNNGFMPIYPEDGDCVPIPGLNLKLSCKLVRYCDTMPRINKSFTYFLFKSDDLCGKMSVRPRREGDTIRLFGHNKSKTLKKLFIERRIPARNRAVVPVIADDSGVLAVYGLGVGSRAVPAPGDMAWRIGFSIDD